jgi:hypothetical protein
LVYFLILLQCIRTDSLGQWFALGCVHGLAFLAKAFALPWLAWSTVVAVLLLSKSWKSKVVRLLLAASIPLVTAMSWSIVLHSKYGVYTTGSQFKANFLQWVLLEYPKHRPDTYALLTDTSGQVDEYMAADPMPPGSWAWTYHASIRQAVPRLLAAERNNLPKVFKELTIVVTPGMLFAFIFISSIMVHRRQHYPAEWRLAVIVASSAASLIFAYSMLVFDERYLYPLIPLLLAVGARFLVTDTSLNHFFWRKISVLLTILGVCFSLAYRSSPFRVLTRDFQTVGYRAGAIVGKSKRPARLVSIGSGPYPEYGVGWEAAYQTAYFGGSRLIATLDSVPRRSDFAAMQLDLVKADPDAIVVWGRPDHSDYIALLQELAFQHEGNLSEKITDPILGEVGTVIRTSR